MAERAREAAEKAVARGPNRPEGHLALGDYQIVVPKDAARAMEQYAAGRLLAPNSVALLAATAAAEARLGRWEASVEHLHQAELEIPETGGGEVGGGSPGVPQGSEVSPYIR